MGSHLTPWEIRETDIGFLLGKFEIGKSRHNGVKLQ